ncbi:MAG: diadenylate cyclase CdaA [Deferribacteraceae bacterium]|jgi:uncharacterized protein (TIGR00159 family)|nr:diadenylate cyclase CdaA [Deferribacteraceae bacterium]
MQDVIRNVLLSMTIYDAIDVAIISFAIYKILQLMRGSRTFYMVVAIISLLLLLVVSKIVGLRTTNWILSNFTGYFFIMIIILFQPEFRRALVALGETRFFGVNKKTTAKMMDEIMRAVTILANRQIGALIVFQKKIDILPIVTIGQFIDSHISRDLLISIFIPYSPLHDGAVIINGSRLTYAGCVLPLTQRGDLSHEFGTRHRAAIGITEETDAVVIVVSEERGTISVVSEGVVSTGLDMTTLQESLEKLLMPDKGD